MKIAVCVKRVPDTETRIKVGGSGTGIDEAGVKFILNPYDEFAVEEALRRKEQAGSGEVTVLSQGSRTPTTGSRVRVKGRVSELGVLGGRALGLHIKEQSLDIRGR